MKQASLLAIVLLVGALTGGAAAAGGPSKCPRGQALVTIAGKASCRPLVAVLPRPSKADQRVVVAGVALVGAARVLGRSAGTVRQAFVKGLALVDRRLRGKRSLQAIVRVEGCDAQGRSGTDSFTSGSGGDTLTGTSRIGNGEATVGIGGTVSGGGKTLKFSYEEDVCGQLDTIPKCPTAQGTVDATKRTRQKVSIDVTEAGKSIFSQTYVWLGNARLHGQVADDAKLDTLDVDDQETFQASGSKLTGTLVTTFHVRVDMRTGNYDPAGATATFTDASGASTASPSRESFASFIGKQISDYRRHEDGWLQPNSCATLELSPAAGKLLLKKGQTGQLQARVKAEDGGTPTGGKWTLSAPANATFNPSEANGPQTQFGYTVTRAGAGIKVLATVRATSPAGVGREEWWEPTKEDLPDRFSGTFSGENRVAGKNAFTGTITFVRNRALETPRVAEYVVESVAFDVTFTAAAPCSGGGSTHVSPPTNPKLAALNILTEETPQGHVYNMAAFFQSAQPMTVTVTCNGVTSQIPWSPGAALVSGPGPFFTDAKTIKGTNDASAAQSTYSWDLKAGR
jgi:hypothetical protein